MSSEAEFSCDDCGFVFSDIMEGRAEPLLNQLVRERLETRESCQRCYETYRKTTELCREQLRRAGVPQLGDRLMSFLRERTGRG